MDVRKNGCFIWITKLDDFLPCLWVISTCCGIQQRTLLLTWRNLKPLRSQVLRFINKTWMHLGASFLVCVKIGTSTKVLGNVKKISLYNQPKPYFFQKIIVKSFLDRSKHSELSIFWLVIYSLCCYEWFLFVHNLNTTNTIRFSYIFQLKINPKKWQ